MEKEKSSVDWKNILINMDQYIAAAIFIFIMLLLSVQVISRYVFNNSFTWTEELANILFVWMTYFGVSSAVTHRKHLRIDALIDAVPFNVKRVLLIISDLVFIAFNTYLIFPFSNIVKSLGSSSTPLLHIPKWISYALIPVMLGIASIKLVVDIWKLCHEKEAELGASKPSMDLDALEQEGIALRAQQKEEAE